MVVARSVEPGSANFHLYNCKAPIVPTKVLTDPDELDRQLLQNGYASTLYRYMESTSEYDQNFQQINLENDELGSYENTINSPEVNGIDFEKEPAVNNDCEPNTDILDTSPVTNTCNTPDSETEKYKLILHKGDHGLGKFITT